MTEEQSLEDRVTQLETALQESNKMNEKLLFNLRIFSNINHIYLQMMQKVVPPDIAGVVLNDLMRLDSSVVLGKVSVESGFEELWSIIEQGREILRKETGEKDPVLGPAIKVHRANLCRLELPYFTFQASRDWNVNESPEKREERWRKVRKEITEKKKSLLLELLKQ